MLELIEYLVLGIGVGTVGSLLGLGGGFILVPIFMMFMIAPNGTTFTTVQQVVGTSLFAVLCNAVSGTVAYLRQGRILMRAAVPFAIATLPGAFLGGYVSEWFSGPGFSLTFGLFMLLISYIMYSKSKGKAANRSVEEWNPKTAEFNMTLGVVCSFFVGFISSIFGIGGGIVHVPMMVFMLGFPPQIAVATSTFVLFVSAVSGVAGHAVLGHIIWGPALMIGVGCVIGAQIGARLAKKSRPRVLVILLSVLVFLIAWQFIYKGAAGMGGSKSANPTNTFRQRATRGELSRPFVCVFTLTPVTGR